jgi:hypothetical protein
MTPMKRPAFQQVAGDFGHATALDAGLLISMAFTCSEPIAYSYPHASIVESGFQFSKPPTLR